MPIKPELAAACDDGAIQTELPGGLLPEALASVEAIPEHEGPRTRCGRLAWAACTIATPATRRSPRRRAARPIYDVLVIGGGASGLAAAITASRAGARTCILERDVETGLSILATGNGRCNVSNSRLDARRYRHPDAVREIFGTTPERDVAAFLESTGIATAEEGEGRLYPMSRRADSVRDALLNTCRREDTTVMACAEPKRTPQAQPASTSSRVDQARLPLSHKPGRD